MHDLGSFTALAAHPQKPHTCAHCRYAPGGHPWLVELPGQKHWCGVGRALVGRSDGKTCQEWEPVL